MSTIKLRRGTAAAWTSANPTLAAGEPGYETDTAKMKIGDGSTAWNSLTYFGGGTGVTFGTPAIALGTAAAAGSISEAIKRDATILAFDATVPVTQAFGDSAATGSAAVAARRDHKHAMPANPVSLATPAIVLGSAAAAGAAGTLIGSDSTIAAFDATSPSTQAFGDSAVVGTAAFAARRDHKHAMPATPTTVSGNAGTATALQTGRAIDGQTFDGTADITVIAPGTHAATSKATPVDADELPLVDSAASNVLKKLTWANLKATLKTYFDTLYSPVGGGNTVVDYAQITTSLNVTATTEGTAQTVVTGGGFTADGTSHYLIEFFSSSSRPDSTAASRTLTLVLFEGSTPLGIIGQMRTPAAAAMNQSLLGAVRLTPSAGSHTYLVGAFVNAGTGVVAAGAGGTGVSVPAYLMATRLAP